MHDTGRKHPYLASSTSSDPALLLAACTHCWEQRPLNAPRFNGDPCAKRQRPQQPKPSKIRLPLAVRGRGFPLLEAPGQSCQDIADSGDGAQFSEAHSHEAVEDGVVQRDLRARLQENLPRHRVARR